MEIWYCPVCGHGPFREPYSSEQELRWSYDICSCCGCEYGYTDNAYGFERWVLSGHQWSDPKDKPYDWNLEEQLKHVIRPWPPNGPSQISKSRPASPN